MVTGSLLANGKTTKWSHTKRFLLTKWSAYTWEKLNIPLFLTYLAIIGGLNSNILMKIPFSTLNITITGERRDGYTVYDDYSAEGGSIYGQYFFNSDATVKISSKKGKIGGVNVSYFRCTGNLCLNRQHQRWWIKWFKRTHGMIHIGLNHYFNSNVDWWPIPPEVFT